MLDEVNMRTFAQYVEAKRIPKPIEPSLKPDPWEVPTPCELCGKPDVSPGYRFCPRCTNYLVPANVGHLTTGKDRPGSPPWSNDDRFFKPNDIIVRRKKHRLEVFEPGNHVEL